jgi:hypothetical protein
MKKEEKLFKITNRQIRSLYFEFTGYNAIDETLGKVKNNGKFWFEYDEAKEDYFDRNDEFKKNYDELKKTCKDDKIVAYKYKPLTFKQMLGNIENQIAIYIKENENEPSFIQGMDKELCDLLLISEIVKQNI